MEIVVLVLVFLGVLFAHHKLYQRFWSENLAILMGFSAKEVFEGDEVVIHQQMSHRNVLPLPWVVVKFYLHTSFKVHGTEAIKGKGFKNEYTNVVFAIKRYQQMNKRITVTCGARGIYQLGNPQLVSTDLLHTQSLMKGFECKAQLFVFPRFVTDTNRLSTIFKNMDEMMQYHSIKNPDPFEFRGIRDYEMTDPLKAINFRASAVAGNLMVNVYAPTSVKKMTLILDITRKGSEGLAAEEAIRVVATLAQKYLNEGIAVGFITNGKNELTGETITLYPSGGSDQLYQILCGLSGIQTYMGTEDILDVLHQRQLSDQMYVLVSNRYGQGLQGALDLLSRRSGQSSTLCVVVGDEAGLKNVPAPVIGWELADEKVEDITER